MSLEPGESRDVALLASLPAPVPDSDTPPRSFAVIVESNAGAFAAMTVDGQLQVERPAVPAPEPEPEPAEPEPAKTEPVRRGFNWKPLLTSVYVGVLGVLAGLMLAQEADRTFWGIVLTAWLVGAPLAAFGWRTTATLSGNEKMLTRAGCLVATAIGSLIVGIAVAILVHTNF